ncbi:scyllo-inositol 2-dehydrogenase (NADP+) [Cohnella sp. OV330]|nr:scyllo-inositol 2-dehydrogenase (NADP+) [Cohnella sp. OV330]
MEECGQVGESGKVGASGQVEESGRVEESEQIEENGQVSARGESARIGASGQVEESGRSEAGERVRESGEIGVGLIGYGYAGRTFHAPVIASVPGLALRAVVERSGDRSKERYPWIRVAKDVAELYDDPTIDLVVIATPSTDHVRFAREALAAGKHVVVEKPMTTTASEADALIALAKAQGRMLSVFHNRRWDGDFLTVRSLLGQGLLGRPVACELRWDGYDPVFVPGNWREGGGPGTGVFYDLGVHLLDQALSLFGMPDAIRGEIRSVREGAAAADSFEVELSYRDGLRVLLGSSRFAREPRPRYALYGTAGSYVKFGTDPQEAALIGGARPGAPGWGREDTAQWGRLNAQVGGLRVEGLVETLPGVYQDYYRNVYDHLSTGAELAVKAEQARDAIRLIELALRSSEERRTLPVAGVTAAKSRGEEQHVSI